MAESFVLELRRAALRLRFAETRFNGAQRVLDAAAAAFDAASDERLAAQAALLRLAKGGSADE